MNKRGFTLVELLVVISIVGILIITGYPSYQSYLRGNRRQATIQEISGLQLQIEDYIAKHNSLPPTTGEFAAHSSSNDGYTITYTPLDSTALKYQITATAKGVQLVDKVGTINCTPLTLQSEVDGITPPECK